MEYLELATEVALYALMAVLIRNAILKCKLKKVVIKNERRNKTSSDSDNDTSGNSP